MATTISFLYEYAKQNMLGRPIGTDAAFITLSATMGAALVLSSATPDQQLSTTGSAHGELAKLRPVNTAKGWASSSNDIVLSSNEVSSSGSGASAKTFFDAADIAFISVSSGESIGGILIYRYTTANSDAGSYPIAFINVATTVANGASINVNWDNGVNRIFALTG